MALPQSCQCGIQPSSENIGQEMVELLVVVKFLDYIRFVLPAFLFRKKRLRNVGNTVVISGQVVQSMPFQELRLFLDDFLVNFMRLHFAADQEVYRTLEFREEPVESEIELLGVGVGGWCLEKKHWQCLRCVNLQHAVNWYVNKIKTFVELLRWKQVLYLRVGPFCVITGSAFLKVNGKKLPEKW